MIAEKVNQYTCTCRAVFLVVEKYGAQQAEKEEKRKRNKDKKKKKKKNKTKKGYHNMDGLLWGIGRGETQPSCSWTPVLSDR